MFAIFRNRNFTLLWVAGLISMIGDWALRIGIPLYVYRMTGSTLATGALLIVGSLPTLIFGSIAGVFVDRWDRRRTMIGVNLLLALCLLPLLFVQSLEQIWVVYVVLFAEGVLSQFFIPAERALLPLLVEPDDLARANTLNSVNGNLARLIGPAVGGLVVALVGLGEVIVLDMASFLLAAGLIVLITDRREVARDETAARTTLRSAWASVAGEWRAGVEYLRRKPALAKVILLTCITMVGEGFFGTLLIPFFTQVIGGTESEYGFFLAAQGVGGIIGGLVIVQTAERFAPERLFAWGALGISIIDLILFTYSLWVPGVLPGIVLIAFAGIPAVAFGAGLMTLLQSLSEDAYRGRVFGIYGTLSALLLLVGAVLAGVLGQHVSILLLMIVQESGYLIAGILAFFLLVRRTPVPSLDAEPGG